jgi:hypothetical protein
LVKVIVAPSITAPLESLTVPLMVAEDCWERAGRGSKSTAAAIRKTTGLLEKNRNMVPSWTA